MDNHKHVCKYLVASWVAATGSVADFKICAYKDMKKTNAYHLELIKCGSTDGVGETKRMNELENLLVRLFLKKAE